MGASPLWPRRCLTEVRDDDVARHAISQRRRLANQVMRRPEPDAVDYVMIEVLDGDEALLIGVRRPGQRFQQVKGEDALVLFPGFVTQFSLLAGREYGHSFGLLEDVSNELLRHGLRPFAGEIGARMA